ncbi:hypothetical protein [Heyndrickxia vini]|uniref:Cytochrome c oxidase subunit I n=1 Tax=Heyndrickxia vini TaxID=1476025 RepID=A0ABX7DYS0_9BACI|nr:hypothetical protein [Heyndrickxia vini]QQZ08618.1 hypothetical protein I5776_16475 [Heyndrickxia vini]
MDRTKLLLRMSALYGVIGAVLGSHMAASNAYAFRPVHAHILVVGWLSLFAFAIYYRVFSIPKKSVLATIHIWTAIVGSFGLTVGMWLYNMKPIKGIETFNLLFFIIGGSLLIICFIVFLLMTFIQGRHLGEEK